MAKNSQDQSRDSAASNKSGRKPASGGKPGRKFSSDFQWGEVDDVQQQEAELIVPSKKHKKRSKKYAEKFESTLTVENPQADLYRHKPSKPTKSAAALDDDLALPSYGKCLEEADDEFDVFLRRAEEAELKAQVRAEKKQSAKKELSKKASVKKEDAGVSSGKKPVSKPDRGALSDTARNASGGKKSRGVSTAPGEPSRSAGGSAVGVRLARIREKAAVELRKIGYSDAEIKRVIPGKIELEDLLDLVDYLLEARQPAVSSAEPATQVSTPAKVSERRAPKSRPPRSGRTESLAEATDEVTAERDRPEPAAKKTASREKSEPKVRGGEGRRERQEVLSAHPEKPRPEPKRSVADSGERESEKNLSFGDIALSRPMLEMLRDAGYLEPTPIQAGTIPAIFDRVDLMGQSRTGSGKTAAFMIPIIEKIEECEPGDDPVALVVAPTRELAVQIRDETVKLSRNREIITVACYGGKPIADQIKKMRNGVDIVIGTPGRILDLTKRRALSLERLRWVVLDEADRMLDIGFRPDIERILKMTPADRQTLLFSATLAPPVIRLAERYMRDPKTFDFSADEISSDTIEQYYMTVDRERKFEALLRLLEREKPTQAIVFCRTKRMVDKLGRGLTAKYHNGVAAIHGDLAQSQRDHIMKAFRAGQVKLLVATDVVGRGIDVTGISHIINYDIPQFCDDYVHRVGRTGRMGREGVAFTLVTSQEGPELTRVEMRINRLLKRIELEGFEAYARPDADGEKQDEPKEQKTVFGKPTRRVRRAL